ncbi:head GIN domain-containing protein [uncultured Acetobacteroides sp.]|uniref:head GIN domain-containing protein n=1 Tax=uncultured Acetobacteroides sp. TaxID=1760811 RepID=UPI0029F4F604|nr:head GIN domain-containing protein [uncultured Acetobacteroides sp.]
MKVAFKVILFAFGLIITSCVKEEVGPGDVTAVKRIGIGYFDKLKVEDGFQVEVVRGSHIEVVVEAPDGYQDNIHTDISGTGELNIYLDKAIMPQDVKHKRVLITMPVLSSITAWGGSEVYTTGIFNPTKFKIDADGGSYVETNIATDELKVVASAGSEVKPYGEAGSLYVDELSGNSKLYGFRLLTSLSDLNLLGGSEAQVTAVDKLVVTASDASIVKYAGHPNIVYSLTGGSLLIDAN